MTDQLVDRYLPQLGATCGVYVVVWMSIPIVTDLRPSHRPKWESIEQARDELAEQTNRLAEQDGITVKTIVVDGALR